MSELLIGCGRNLRRKLWHVRKGPEWRHLVTCDSNPAVKPDVVWDLNLIPWPFDSDSFDEVHAYEVLEHLGRQGDAESFFAHFAEIWRVLKPGGALCATVPQPDSLWVWGDPSHTRVISPASLVFLDQSEYVKQCDASPPTAMSDFRSIYRADFRLAKTPNGKPALSVAGESLGFILEAVKPSRWRAP